MKLAGVRAALIAAEIVGATVGVCLAAAVFLFWRAQSAPMSLDWTGPAIRYAANTFFVDGSVRKIGEVTLSKLDSQGGYQLSLQNLKLGKNDSAATASVAKIDIAIYPKDLLSGKFGPRRVMIDGGVLRIVRRADRRVKVDFGESASERAQVFQSLTGGPYFRHAFESADLRHMRISFFDEASGRSWSGEDASARLLRTRDGYSADLVASFEAPNGVSGLSFRADYDLATETISLNLSTQNAPVGDLLAVFFNADRSPFTSMLSGEAAVKLTGGGQVISSAIDFSAKKGVLSIGDWSTNADGFRVEATFDPVANRFSISELSLDSGAGAGKLAGEVMLTPDQTGRGVEKIAFSLRSNEVSLSPSKFVASPLKLQGVSVDGDYDIKAKSLALDEMSASTLGIELAGNLKFASAGKASPAIAANATLGGSIDPARLLRIWPESLAGGARVFVRDRLPEATFSNLQFKLDLPAGAAPKGAALPDDAMSLSFLAERARVIYAPGMTPLTGVSGKGVLRGNSFHFDAAQGNVGGVRIEGGSVDFPIIKPKGELATFKFRAVGDAKDMMTVLADEPLAVLKETTLTPQQFSGLVTADIEIKRPNLSVAPIRSYQYGGVAKFSDLSVSSIFRDADLTSAKGVLTLSTASMAVKATSRLAGAAVEIDWRQKFFGGGDKTDLVLRGQADSAAADIFGVPTRQNIRGPIVFRAHAIGGVRALRKIDLTADFAKAALISETLGWMKAQGIPAAGSAVIEFAEGRTFVNGVSFRSEGAEISGDAVFGDGGRLDEATFPTVKLDGAADFRFAAARTDAGELRLTITGDYLNGARFVEDLLEKGVAGGAKAPMGLTARLNRIDLRAGAVFENAFLDFRRGPTDIEVFSLAAMDNRQKPLTISLKPTGDGDFAAQKIEARSENIGELLRGAFGATSIRGGRGLLEMNIEPSDGGAKVLHKGVLNAQGIRVVNAPLLAKIFAAGSLTGLVDLVNGDGIEFTTTYAKFAVGEGRVQIDEARATGSSVGLTAQGAFDLKGERAIALTGAVAPVYAVNSILGKTPLIGGLFVNRQGEGLLAISYNVDGPSAEPRITVNPLSALAPGVLRRMFEGEAKIAPPREKPGDTKPPTPAAPSIDPH